MPRWAPSIHVLRLSAPLGTWCYPPPHAKYARTVRATKMMRHMFNVRLGTSAGAINRFHPGCDEMLRVAMWDRSSRAPEAAQILFTLLAECYVRRSMFIASNSIFVHWDWICRHQMVTSAATDRLVHHSVLVERIGPSFRTEHATRSKFEADFSVHLAFILAFLAELLGTM
jgi:hypothetical protein